ncbi:MAG: hypothetical protein J6D20_07660 [Clostridia bacterium]|nr:hypothetical protein [Clostridia bacterium]
MAKFKSKFTRAERQAYHSGKGYAVAHKKRGINFKFANLKASFARGYNKGLQMMKRNPLKYGQLPKKTRKKRG